MDYKKILEKHGFAEPLPAKSQEPPPRRENGLRMILRIGPKAQPSAATGPVHESCFFWPLIYSAGIARVLGSSLGAITRSIQNSSMAR